MTWKGRILGALLIFSIGITVGGFGYAKFLVEPCETQKTYIKVGKIKAKEGSDIDAQIEQDVDQEKNKKKKEKKKFLFF
jgi:hypothetical protein